MNPPTLTDPKLTIEWLNKLVMMAQWRGKLPFHAVRLISEPETYKEFRLHVREGTTGDTDITDDAVRNAREQLLEAVASWPSLKEMFSADDDPFAGAPVDRLQLLAEVSDITTDPQKMVYSRNGTFLAVVEALRQSQELEPAPLLVDGLHKFLTLLATHQTVAEMLYNLAEEPYWLVVMASLRDDRDYLQDEEAVVKKTLEDWQAKLTTELRALLFKPGHLSRAPTKLIRMAWNNQHLFREAHDSIPAESREQDPVEEWRQVANAALALFEEKAHVECEEVKADLMVLATVARHFINVRKFAKLDGFVYTWPDIARLAMSNYPALEYVEDLLVNRKPRPGDTELDAREARELYELCARNDRLIRFLRLRPRFAEIDDDELRRYRPLAPVVITETTLQPPSAATRAASGSVDFPPPAPSPAPPPAPSMAAPFENSHLEFVKQSDAAVAPNLAYEISLRGPGYTIAGYKVDLSAEKLFEQLRVAIGVSSDNEAEGVLRDLFATSPAQAEARMTRGGSLLMSKFLSASMQEKISNLLFSNQPFRLVITSSESEPHYLPWEWLPRFPPSQLFLSTPDHSVVRLFATAGEMTSGLLTTPLRLMSIIPPAPVGRRFTADNTIKALENLFSTDEAVRYTPLTREEATLERIMSEVALSPPNVVHFEGHITVSTTNPEVHALELYLAGRKPILIEDFGRLLKEKGVQVLVIGRNSMVQMYQNIGARAALLLAQQGVPAIIAPMRAIDDASATTFTTEFYRAFLQGNTLESALYIARRKLASKGGDWSVFALFADPARLDYFQLLRESA